jgi:hypothetical protein
MARVRPVADKDKRTAESVVMVEVPKADLGLAQELTWGEVLDLAAQSGWRVRTETAWTWCAKDHALLREGSDEMKTIPVLLFQNWGG